MISVNYNEIKWGLEELANKDEQMRLWCGIGNDTNEISSLVEASCSVFNYDVERLLENKSAAFELPETAVSLLMELRKKLACVPHDLPPKEQVEHSVMGEVRNFSQKLLQIICNNTQL